MKNVLLYPAGITPAVKYATGFLNLPTTAIPTPETTHILLDVPLRSGNWEAPLSSLPADVTVIGGNLHFPGHNTMDLLQDEGYLAKNAAITAHCALRLGLDALPVTPEGCPVLILGWGRIGKCLAQLLRGLGATVTVAARDPAHRAMLDALGYRGVAYPQLPEILGEFRLLYNTVPVKLLPDGTIYPPELVAVELSSLAALPGNVIDGRGLPGKMAPESSGKLIAETILRRL